MEVVLVRHTHVGLDKNICYGFSDVPVAETFEQEAAVTKAKLKEFEPFDKVYSSPLSRAKKLASFCGYPNATIDDRLKEMDMGTWEMKRFDEIKDPNLHKWHDDYMHLAPTGGESFTQLYNRVASFLDELKKKEYKKVVIFAHGGVLICAGVYGGLFPPEECFENLVECGGLEKIII